MKNIMEDITKFTARFSHYDKNLIEKVIKKNSSYNKTITMNKALSIIIQEHEYICEKYEKLESLYSQLESKHNQLIDSLSSLEFYKEKVFRLLNSK